MMDMRVPIPMSFLYNRAIDKTTPKNGMRGEMRFVEESPTL